MKKIMKQNKINVISWIIAIVNVIISLLYILQLPEVIPTHFNLNWVCDGMGSRWTGMFTTVLPLLFCMFFPQIRKYIGKENVKYSGITQFAFMIYFVVLHWDVLFTMRSGIQIGDQLESGSFIWILFGSFSLLYIVMGNYMPVIQQNHFLGFRVKWTLENEACWRVTHRFAGKLFVIFGICSMLLLLLGIILDIPAVSGSVVLFLMLC
ncbi:MAG: SdpI family protein, partial [Oscillospiraceae bacterium]|nr:SdpI family protein [Oscillospiraceae bacterium]